MRLELKANTQFLQPHMIQNEQKQLGSRWFGWLRPIGSFFVGLITRFEFDIEVSELVEEQVLFPGTSLCVTGRILTGLGTTIEILPDYVYKSKRAVLKILKYKQRKWTVLGGLSLLGLVSSLVYRYWPENWSFWRSKPGSVEQAESEYY